MPPFINIPNLPLPAEDATNNVNEEKTTRGDDFLDVAVPESAKVDDDAAVVDHDEITIKEAAVVDHDEIIIEEDEEVAEINIEKVADPSEEFTSGDDVDEEDALIEEEVNASSSSPPLLLLTPNKVDGEFSRGGTGKFPPIIPPVAVESNTIETMKLGHGESAPSDDVIDEYAKVSSFALPGSQQQHISLGGDAMAAAAAAAATAQAATPTSVSNANTNASPPDDIMMAIHKKKSSSSSIPVGSLMLTPPLIGEEEAVESEQEEELDTVVDEEESLPQQLDDNTVEKTEVVLNDEEELEEEGGEIDEGGDDKEKSENGGGDVGTAADNKEPNSLGGEPQEPNSTMITQEEDEHASTDELTIEEQDEDEDGNDEANTTTTNTNPELCNTAKWHIAPKLGKCTNSPTDFPPQWLANPTVEAQFMFEKREDCCMKFIPGKDCDAVDVCDGGGDGGDDGGGSDAENNGSVIEGADKSMTGMPELPQLVNLKEEEEETVLLNEDAEELEGEDIEETEEEDPDSGNVQEDAGGDQDDEEVEEGRAEEEEAATTPLENEAETAQVPDQELATKDKDKEPDDEQQENNLVQNNSPGEEEEQTEAKIEGEEDATTKDEDNPPSPSESEMVGSSTTEGQGAEISKDNTKKNWEGFDEDFTGDKIQAPEGETTSHKSHDVSELKDVQDYEGDGFRFHVLRPKGAGKGSSFTPTPLGAAMALLAAFLLCFCFCRYRRNKRNNHSHRGKYSVLHGSDDFFNGTFSDDVSFHGKDSDDEMSTGSYDSGDEGGYGGNGVKLEMGGIHEMDANGGLTLDECNG